ncbi:hypothetical protein CAMGR0001_1236 [Campylobacter gracilis RM3268]|uniref:Uncharacterized protein n=1 Tax=Campylobacter gracilis RM3268 TaxID=553220 RepID=C8PJ37_9BACT|nr:hypothetical protein CAMGR0001_1236 [Campylobacter gracilis RM3268]
MRNSAKFKRDRADIALPQNTRRISIALAYAAGKPRKMKFYAKSHEFYRNLARILFKI